MSIIRLSPSAVNKWNQCQRLYSFGYVEGIWEATSDKMEFGKEVHTHLELWMTDATPPPDTPAGHCAKQLLDKGWLPPPGPQTLKEQHMHFSLFPGAIANGYIDLVIPPGIMGVDPIVTDYKSTSSLKWAKTAEDLDSDPQALMYAAWTMFKYQVRQVKVQWLYTSATNPKPKNVQGNWIQPPRKPNGARQVENVFEADDPDFRYQWGELLKKMKGMVEVRHNKTPALQLAPSPESCGMYRGCFQRKTCNLSGGDILSGLLS